MEASRRQTFRFGQLCIADWLLARAQREISTDHTHTYAKAAFVVPSMDATNEGNVYLVVGGGIAGSTCAIELSRLSPSSQVILVSPSSNIKTLQDLEQITPSVGIVHVQDRSADDFSVKYPRVKLVCDKVVSVDPTLSQAKLSSGQSVYFFRCCVATGASPAIACVHPRVIGIRDTESVENMKKLLSDAKTVLIVGNGGIAMELVHSLVSTKACQVVWAVRNSYIGNTFFDASASAFFLQSIASGAQSGPRSPTRAPAHRREVAATASVGPDWASQEFHGTPQEAQPDRTRSSQSLLDIQYECELSGVCDGDTCPLSATLTNGVCVKCDFVISATGVHPRTDVLSSDFERGRDGGLRVNETMRVVRSCSTTKTDEAGRAGDGREATLGSDGDGALADNVFAAGDCCCLEWPQRESDHWFQVRLWRQARATGLYAAQCMTDSVDELGSGGAFELFVHATNFFGFQVTLLGRFNGQGLEVGCSSIQDVMSHHKVCVDGDLSSRPTCHHESIHITAGSSNIQVLIRTTPGSEYIKVHVVDGQLRGAMLIGKTGLEETLENLILSGTDISHIGEDLLNPEVDIEDFFD